MIGVTFDSGALMAIDRRKQSMLQRLATMKEFGIKITVPSVVIAEWWRGGSGKHWRERTDGYVLEPTLAALTRLAGEAIAAVPGSTAVDAIVMASASLRGDNVYTSDFDDLSRLQLFFRGVRVFRV
jgi:hypothetical protein